MAPISSTLMSSGSRKKEPRYVYLSETKASHSHRLWPEVSSSVPHFLQMGLLLSPIIYRCLLKVLCPVSWPITTLDCVLLKDNNRAPVPVPVAARSAAARLVRSWVRIPSGAWMFVLCECCVLSGRGLCDELITRPDESYRLWCVVVCDL